MLARLTVLAVVLSVCLLVIPTPTARAHDGDVVTSFPDYVPQDFVHEDEDPWKGWINLTATNTGDEAWGDFHFEIYDPIGGQDISNVHFLDASMGGFDPTSSQSPLTWDIDNDVVGATIDLYYYTDPVYPGEDALFSVWTDNPDHLSFFGVMLFPTPVPEPATMLLLTAGILFVKRPRR